MELWVIEWQVENSLTGKFYSCKIKIIQEFVETLSEKGEKE
jgi:hypothetical protein